MTTIAGLPQLPAPHTELVEHIAQNPDKPMVDIMDPYRRYEAELRTAFAQDRSNPALDDPYINVVPLFTPATEHITTRARDLAAESEQEKSRYVMALPDDKRRPHGSPATVASIGEFQKNFNLFSESSLVELDWNNVVAAGSSAINCLLPVPDEFKVSKRKLREYYHEKFCPASDVDLFLYGLTHDEAIEKIKQIEQSVRDALLSEVTVVRTKYAITIASQYPVRHVQIVLRVYKSVSEILTGFDIDSAGGAYDGKQVYVTPRALGSFITQINHIDLSRRSPSYENRLSKYSHRNFEVYWPELDRSRVDPTIFERSFKRTLGLARLLVLERLPTNQAREAYLNKRRVERGRPTVHRDEHRLYGDIKSYHEDETADWLSEADISNYHTFTVPYGEKFHAKRIEKLCYTRDLLLNAEWNQPDERKVYLHRHPAFFGRVEDVIEDCCGSCPSPVTQEEIEVAEKEAEIYISGKISFLIDDPGRQQIGSFNPLTENDWTDMAYVGNTARLCQSIVDGDVEDVLNWLSQEEADPNQRDYTGRSPLHLAAMVSSPEVVRCLVEHGARLTARLADGKTALHLAASRGNTEVIKILMEKSIENEEMEEEKQTRRRTTPADKDNADAQKKLKVAEDGDSDASDEDSDVDLIDGAEAETERESMATGSFVKVKKGDGGDKDGEEPVPDEADDSPDYYHIDIVSWDIPCSPLHLAIAEGHEDAVRCLCDFGADSILPVKFLNRDSPDSAAILTLTLALSLPSDKAKSMARLLLDLGATSSQADSNGCTAFHRYIDGGNTGPIDVLLENDQAGIKSAINHMLFTGYYRSVEAIAPLHTAVAHGDPILVLKLLNAGALSQIDFDTWLKAAKTSSSNSCRLGNLEENKKTYRRSCEQLLITAVRSGNIQVAMRILDDGADPNCLTTETEMLMDDEWMRRYNKGSSVLDIVQTTLKKLQKYTGEALEVDEPHLPQGMDDYVQKFKPGTYQHWIVSEDVAFVKRKYEGRKEAREKEAKRVGELNGATEKKEAIDDMIAGFETLERALVAKGSKPFAELHPDIKTDTNTRHHFTNVQDKEPKHYEHTFVFHDRDLTEARREGCIELMEAAWTGDLERIKCLTLQAWGPTNEQPPLKAAITDIHNNSPFSLAFFQRHWDVARAILEIVKTQWSPIEKDRVRYKLDNPENDSDSDEDAYNEDSDSEPRIVSEQVDKAFTIDNIGQVSMQVESHSKPLSILTSHCPSIFFHDGKLSRTPGTRSLFVHVMEAEDTAGLKFLLDVAQHYSGDRYSDDDDDTRQSFTFPMEDFRWAVENGKTQLLGHVIKRTGAGMPLDELVKKSGVKMERKPRYYQGLSVYGKKRNDWATAGRNMVVKTSGLKTPPLLHGALGGHVESVEFFLGDTPHRLYIEFSKSKAGREDSRLHHLMNSPGGFDRAISKWLGADNDLVVHCAVLATPSDHANELLEYLVKTFPESLEKKSSLGDTPLMVACRLGRPYFVKILVAGNADQSTKNLRGENVIHAAVAGNPKASQLRHVLESLDAGLRSYLFTQRKSLQENGTTPLHAWISQACGLGSGEVSTGTQRNRYYMYRPTNPYKEQTDVVEMAKLLLEYSGGVELDMLNGAGETCLHTAIMNDMVSLVRVLVDFKPAFLFRENAVGRTPAEIAHDRFTGQQFDQPRTISLPRNRKPKDIVDKDVDEFVRDSWLQSQTPEQIKGRFEKVGLSDDYSASILCQVLGSMGMQKNPESLSDHMLKQVAWDLCRTAMEKNPSKRRLVSLNEANDVARRLGETHTGSRYFSVQSKRDDDEEEQAQDENDNQDFASKQMLGRINTAWQATHRPAEEGGLWCNRCKAFH